MCSMLSLLTPRQSDQVGGPIGSLREAKKVESYPNYDSAYLARRLGAANPQILERNRYNSPAAGFNSVTDELVYLQNATKGYEAEAEECLKKEFKDWLTGVHPDNINPQSYDNDRGGAIRRDMHGQRVEGWKPTWWGPHQLTYLPGVREYLREQAERADKNSLDLNVLAHLGPQNLEEAWAYFKHWVKARPVGPEVCLNPSSIDPETERELPLRAGPIHMQHDTKIHPDRFTPNYAVMRTRGGFFDGLLGDLPSDLAPPISPVQSGPSALSSTVSPLRSGSSALTSTVSPLRSGSSALSSTVSPLRTPTLEEALFLDDPLRQSLPVELPGQEWRLESPRIRFLDGPRADPLDVDPFDADENSVRLEEIIQDYDGSDEQYNRLQTLAEELDDGDGADMSVPFTPNAQSAPSPSLGLGLTPAPQPRPTWNPDPPDAAQIDREFSQVFDAPSDRSTSSPRYTPGGTATAGYSPYPEVRPSFVTPSMSASSSSAGSGRPAAGRLSVRRAPFQSPTRDFGAAAPQETQAGRRVAFQIPQLGTGLARRLSQSFR